MPTSHDEEGDDNANGGEEVNDDDDSASSGDDDDDVTEAATREMFEARVHAVLRRGGYDVTMNVTDAGDAVRESLGPDAAGNTDLLLRSVSRYHASMSGRTLFEEAGTGSPGLPLGLNSVGCSSLVPAGMPVVSAVGVVQRIASF